MALPFYASGYCHFMGKGTHILKVSKSQIVPIIVPSVFKTGPDVANPWPRGPSRHRRKGTPYPRDLPPGEWPFALPGQ